MIAFTERGLTEPLQRTLITICVMILLSWVALSGWVVARGLVRPIRDLAQRARAIERGRFEAHPESARRDELGELIRAFARMSDSVRRHHHDIRKLAYHDSLTGLPNRLMFRELLDESIVERRSEGQGIALLFVDLDDFKRINDTLGHDAGDDVLIEFAGRLKRALEAQDPQAAPVLARLGGDEFVAASTSFPWARRSLALESRAPLQRSTGSQQSLRPSRQAECSDLGRGQRAVARGSSTIAWWPRSSSVLSMAASRGRCQGRQRRVRGSAARARSIAARARLLRPHSTARRARL